MIGADKNTAFQNAFMENFNVFPPHRRKPHLHGNVNMLNVNNLIGFGAGGGDLKITYITNVSDTANATTRTFSSVSIGSPSSDRLVVVVIHCYDTTGATVNTCTIGGTDATKLVEQVHPVTTSMFGLVVSSGTTADIVTTMNKSTDRAAIGVYTVTGWANTTPANTGTNTGSGSVSVSATANRGGIVAASVQNTGNIIWTNATEDYDIAVESNNQYSGAQFSLDASITADGAAANHSIAYASWD